MVDILKLIRRLQKAGLKIDTANTCRLYDTKWCKRRIQCIRIIFSYDNRHLSVCPFTTRSDIDRFLSIEETKHECAKSN